jgi:hypothetical protein
MRRMVFRVAMIAGTTPSRSHIAQIGGTAVGGTAGTRYAGSAAGVW